MVEPAHSQGLVARGLLVLAGLFALMVLLRFTYDRRLTMPPATDSQIQRELKNQSAPWSCERPVEVVANLDASEGIVRCADEARLASCQGLRAFDRVVLHAQGCEREPQAMASQVRLALGHGLDINRASAEDFMLLRGVGEKRARAIVGERQRRGGFESLEDLTEVKGIGPKTLERLRPNLSLGRPAPGQNADSPDGHKDPSSP